MIVRNPMQLKAYIKKMAADKKSPRVSHAKLYDGTAT